MKMLVWKNASNAKSSQMITDALKYFKAYLFSNFTPEMWTEKDLVYRPETELCVK